MKRFLGIGNNDYQHHRPLVCAKGDVLAIGEILHDFYGVRVEKEDLLLDATCKEMNEAFKRYTSYQSFDTLVLYYAGHGYTDDLLGRSYWLPVDAGSDVYEKSRWIDAGAIVSAVLAKIPAKHILVLSDSCFSGALLQSRNMIEPKRDWKEHAHVYRSREILTSGLDTPVDDSGLGSHSPFAYHVKQTLQDNEEPYIDALYLYDRIRRGVIGQAPQYGVLPQAGHQVGGACILERTTGTHTKKSRDKSFSHVQKYAVSFDAQGGACSESSPTLIHYGTTCGPLPIPQRPGYIFDGWWTAADGQGHLITEHTVYSFKKPIVLYAKWVSSSSLKKRRRWGAVGLIIGLIISLLYVDNPIITTMLLLLLTGAVAYVVIT